MAQRVLETAFSHALLRTPASFPFHLLPPTPTHAAAEETAREVTLLRAAAGNEMFVSEGANAGMVAAELGQLKERLEVLRAEAAAANSHQRLFKVGEGVLRLTGS